MSEGEASGGGGSGGAGGHGGPPAAALAMPSESADAAAASGGVGGSAGGLAGDVVDGSGAALYSSKKEPGGNFFLSFDPMLRMCDLVHPVLGLWQFPCCAYYSREYSAAEALVAIRVPRLSAVEGASHFMSDCGVRARLPPRVVMAVLEANKAFAAESRPLFDLHVVVADVSDLVPSLGRSVNIVHHAWAAPNALAFKKTRCTVTSGAFTTEDSRVEPLRKVDMAVDHLGKLRVSIHSMGGGMACSPNNGRLLIGVRRDKDGCIVDPRGKATHGMSAVSEAEEVSHGPAFFWTVSTADPAAVKRGNGPTGMPTCVTLQLVYTSPAAATTARAAMAESTTVSDLLDSLAESVGEASPAIQALFYTLCYGPSVACDDDLIDTREAPAKSVPLARHGPPTGHGAGGAAGEPRVCSACWLAHPRSLFSKSQWSKPPERRRCIACIESGRTPTDLPPVASVDGAGVSPPDVAATATEAEDTHVEAS